MEQETGSSEPQPVDNCLLKWCWILLKSWADTTVTARLARSARSAIIVSTSPVHHRSVFIRKVADVRGPSSCRTCAKRVLCESESIELWWAHSSWNMCLHSSLKGRTSACVDHPRSSVVLVTTVDLSVDR